MIMGRRRCETKKSAKCVDENEKKTRFEMRNLFKTKQKIKKNRQKIIFLARPFLLIDHTDEFSMGMIE